MNTNSEAMPELRSKISIKDVTIGIKIMGIYIIPNEERPFTRGVPWEITKIEFYHRSEATAKDYFRLIGRSSDGHEQSIGIFSEDEGVLLWTEGA